MSENDHLEDVLLRKFSKTEGVSVLDGCSSRSMCASVDAVERVKSHVGAEWGGSSHLLLRAIADVYKSLLNTPSTNADKDSQVKRALVLPTRRSVGPQKNTIQVAADNSQETGDSISLGDDMDSGDDKSERNIHNTSDSKDKNTQFIVTMDGYHSNAVLVKNFYTEGLFNNVDEISKTNNEIIIPPESKELKTKEKEPVKTTEKVLDEQVQRLSNTSEENVIQADIYRNLYRIYTEYTQKYIQADKKKEKRKRRKQRKKKERKVLDPPVVKKRKVEFDE